MSRLREAFAGLIGRVMDLPRGQRTAALLLLACLPALVCAGVAVLPRWNLARANWQSVQEREAEKLRREGLARDPEELRQRVRRLRGDLRRAIAQLPDEKEIPDLLSSVTDAGREAGLEIIVFRQRPEAPQDYYAEVPVEVVVRGTYQQVAAFFVAVAKLDRIVTVTDISIKNPWIEDGQVLLETACAATTYRFLDEEERARLAEEREKQSRKRR